MIQVEIIKKTSKPVVVSQPKRTVEVESGANMAPHALRNHTDVEVATVVDGQMLRYEKNTWENFTPNWLTQSEAAITYEVKSAKGQANGYASLDGGGKIPASQLPNSVMELQGGWDASTNTPELVDGVGNPGDVYEVTTPGVVDFGSGPIVFNMGDWAVYGADNLWYKSLNSNEVTSVHGRTGTVMAVADDYTLYYLRHDTAAQGLSSQNKVNAQTNLGLVYADGAVLFAGVNGLIASDSAAFKYHYLTGNLSIGNSVDSGYKLDITGDAQISGFWYLNALRTRANNHTITIRTATSGVGVNILPTGGTASSMSLLRLNHSSGTSQSFNNIQNSIEIAPFINHSNATIGNGIVRAVYVNPDINAVSQYRAIEWTHAAVHGWGLYGAGSAKNYLNGALLLGSDVVSPCAILKATSTTQGWLPPSMSGIQAEDIDSLEEGLFLYVHNGNGLEITSKGWWGWNGSNWEKFNN